jgi:hypothetical protein
MGWRDRLTLIGRGRAGSAAELHVGDPRFDDWAVVRDFEERGAARAWCQHLAEHGIDAVLTADWPLDEFGRGDIALRVENDRWVEADERLSEP